MAVSKSSLIKTTEYFNQFPLLSSKYLDYVKWSSILELAPGTLAFGCAKSASELASFPATRERTGSGIWACGPNDVKIPLKAFRLW